MLQKPPHSCFLFVNFNYLLITSISKAIYPAGFAAFWGFCSGIKFKKIVKNIHLDIIIIASRFG
jgi:hypothetical protein